MLQQKMFWFRKLAHILGGCLDPIFKKAYMYFLIQFFLSKILVDQNVFASKVFLDPRIF